MEKTVLKRTTTIIENLYPVIIVLFCLGYSSLYFFNTYPVSEGWNIFNAELLLRGKMPYRDFYYYLPPLNLVFDAILWKLSFGKLLIYRMWYLFQRIVILLLLNHLLSKHFLRHIALFSVLISSVLFSFCEYDLFGDYNQTMAFLSVCLLFPAMSFAKYRDSKYLILAGLIIGLMFLTKQPVFVATTTCYFLVLSIYCIQERDGLFWKYFGKTVLGFAFTVLPCLFWLAVNDALLPFFEQVFQNVDGKGSLLHLLLLNTAHNMKSALPVILVFSFAYFIDRHINVVPFRKIWNSIQTWPSFRRLVFYIVVVYVLLIGLILVLSEIENHFIIPITISVKTGNYPVFMLFVFFASTIAGCIIALQNSAKSQAFTLIIFFVGVMITMYYIAIVMEPDEAVSIQKTFFKSTSTMSLPLAGAFAFVGLNYCLIKRKTEYAFLLCGAFSLYYAGTMGAGETNVIPLSVMVAFPVMLCLLLSLPVSHRFYRVPLYSLILTLCATILLVGTAQKKVVPYSWWGYSEKTDEKVTETNLPAMKGIRVTENEKEMFEEVARLIEKNTLPDDEVWGYPYIKLFNILCDRYTMHSFVPVLFPDVVADRYVVQADQLISENLPSIILWKKIPGMLKTHEDVFRDGEKLKQRDLERHIRILIKKNYSILGYYNGIEVYGQKNRDYPLIRGNTDSIISIDLKKNEIDENTASQVISYEINNPLSFPVKAEISFQLKPSGYASHAHFKLFNQKIHNIEIQSADAINSKIEVNLKPGRSDFRLEIEYEKMPDRIIDEGKEVVFLRVNCL